MNELQNKKLSQYANKTVQMLMTNDKKKVWKICDHLHEITVDLI